MADYVVLKRLTLKSDLGWFRSVFNGHRLKTKQKAITLNKEVMNDLWPSLLIRQHAYEKHKATQAAAKAGGTIERPAFEAAKAAAKAVGTIPVDVAVHGPGGKPPISLQRVIALQDKNWRLNGDFVTDPQSDPTRFQIMQEGDLALIGFDDVGWPANAVVVLLSQSLDAALWADFQNRVSRGSRSMVTVDLSDLDRLAQVHGLPLDHGVRILTLASATPRLSSLEAGQNILGKSTGAQQMTPAELTGRLQIASEVGYLGEVLVDAYLSAQSAHNQQVYTWVSRSYASHPYDFEVLMTSGSVKEVIDAKSTSGAWTGEFYMSAAEILYASSSPVPYRIYRISDARLGKNAELRISDDIRKFAAAIKVGTLASALAGTRITEIGIAPMASGVAWSGPITLPLPPA